MCICHFQDDVILLLRPESLRVLLSCANMGFRYLNPAGITEFKYERKNEKDSGRSSKMTPSCLWPIGLFCGYSVYQNLTICMYCETTPSHY